MTERERKLAALGFEYAEGIERAKTITIPSTGREVRKTANGTWETQPHNDNYWQEFDDLLEAIRFATPPAKRPASPPPAAEVEPGDGPEEVVLPRTGLAPLKFRGELVAWSDGSRQGGREQNRWHELAVYRTAGGKFVVSVEYHTRWQGEQGHEVAAVVDGPADVVRKLAEYDPAEDVQGYPPGPAYADKQARLVADVTRRYKAQVSEVLAGEEFAEEVD